MLIYDNKAFNEGSRNNYIALGSFDGLHLGHLSLVRKVRELAIKNGGKSIVFTFKNHPRAFINNNNLELILRELKKEKEGTYRAAVLALSQQCDIDAIDVENFVEALKKEEVRAFFHKTWQGLDSHRSLMCGRK